jgi:hypothetical protein
MSLYVRKCVTKSRFDFPRASAARPIATASIAPTPRLVTPSAIAL